MKSVLSSLCVAVSFASILAACANGGAQRRFDDEPSSTTTGAAGTFSTSTTGTGFGGTLSGVDPGMMDPPACTAMCMDFPAAPIFDGVPESSADMFKSPAGAGTGPCVLEPPDGALFPNNWTRPRVHFKGAGSVNQITFHTPKEVNDLVVYTAKDSWIMPKEIWKGLAASVWEEDVTVTVRAAGGAASVNKFQIAPVGAGGSVVYWGSTSTNPGLDTSTLYGFSPGDDGVIVALKPAMVTAQVLDDSPKLKRAEFGAAEGQVRCIGCHSSTPDGAAVAFTNHWPWNITMADVKQGDTGKTPSYVTPMGALIAQLPWQGVTTFSNGVWGDNLHRYVSSFAPRTAYSTDPSMAWATWSNCPGGACNKTNKDELIWVNLQADGTAPSPTMNDATNLIPQALAKAKGTGWDIIARTGDTHGAVTPAWSHSGTTIAYTSTDSTADGHVGTPTVCDIYGVPYNSGAGGPAAPIKGASDPTACEYYPSFSADDKYIAYNRVDSIGGKPIYYRQDGQIYIARADGTGSGIRLSANDPPACGGENGKAIFNSWPKWSPLPKTANGKSYYFLVFSSARDSWGTILVKPDNSQGANEPASQLYMAAIVDDGQNPPVTFPAIYLWNQRNLVTGAGAGAAATVTDVKTTNVTPAWNEFQIPPVPPADIK
jgi:hypothetical protein